MPIRDQVLFFTNYLFFRRNYADKYTYPHTLRFSDTLCLKNALNTFFLKLHFISLYSFSLPPKHLLSALKLYFLQITFFSAVITRTHHLPTHTPFFRHIMPKKRAENLFLKITFFSTLLLLLTPETLPNHLFRQTNHQK